MADWRNISFHIPEAQQLADLAGVETDLLATERICDRFIIEIEKERPDWELLDIICAAAVIRYGRTSTSGVRSGVPKDLLEGLDPQFRTSHQFFKDVRDKWIAHSVNAFEENEVAVWLMPPERGPMAVVDVTVRQQRVASLSVGDIKELKVLSLAVRERLKVVMVSEKEKVLAIARAQPLEPFYSQKEQPHIPNNQSPSKARKRK